MSPKAKPRLIGAHRARLLRRFAELEDVERALGQQFFTFTAARETTAGET